MKLASTVEIRPLAQNLSALPMVAAWYYEAWGCADGLTLDMEQRKLGESLAGSSFPETYLALAQERLMGVIQLKLQEMPQLPHFVHWLGSVYVDPLARGGGVARALVNYAAEQATLRDIHQLYLQTEDLTGGLYYRCGWAPVSIAESHGRRVLVMVRHSDPQKLISTNLLGKSSCL